MADRTTSTPAAEGDRSGTSRRRRRPRPVLDDLESLRTRAEGAEQQRDEYLDLLQRTRADFENYRKRTRRDLAEERRYAHGRFRPLVAAGPGQPATGPGRRPGSRRTRIR